MAILARPTPSHRELIPIEVAELKSLQFHILEAFDAFCRQHGLTYYLNGGTLLGAVVHRGYIPWDDDIDVIMPRRDYDRFCTLLASDPTLMPGYDLSTSATRADYPLPFAKLGALGTLVIDHSARDLRVPVNIDVFPLDGWAPPGPRRWLQRTALAWDRRLIEMHLGRIPANWRAPFVMVAKFLMLFGNPNLKAQTLESRLRRYSARYGNEVGLLAWGVGSVIPAEEYGVPSPLPFEGRGFAGPTKPEAILTRCYSPQFREVPPAHLQVSNHRFSAYRIQGHTPS